MGVTLRDIAERASASTAVVSYVINNKRPEAVSSGVRQRVLAAIDELNYRPHGLARGLALQKSHNVGVAIYDLRYLHDSYFSVVVSEIGCVVGLYDYNLQFTVTNSQPDAEQRNLFIGRKVAERRLDGCIIMDQAVGDDTIVDVARNDIPFVLIDRYVPGKDFGCVMVDNREGMSMATEHLLKLGHRKIGMMVERVTQCKASEMLRGYRQALAKYGLRYDERFVKEVELEKDEEYGATERLLDMPDRPTAILLSSDAMAVGSFEAVRKRNLKIPEDVAFVSFNDTVQAISMEPHLTTVRVPLQELGRAAAEMLFKLIEGKEVAQRRVELEPQLVIRDSCGAKLLSVGQGKPEKAVSGDPG